MQGRDPAERLAGHAGGLGVAHDLGEGGVTVPRVPVEAGDAGVADTSLGNVDDPFEGHLVGGVGDGPEVGEKVLDLGPVVEAGSADHLVGDVAADELFLDGPALGVGAVEDRHVAPFVGTFVGAPVQVLDLGRQPAPLVVLVLSVEGDERGAAALLGPQRLGLAHGVVRDDGVGGVEDRLGGAVVLLQDHHGGVREGVLELQDVADVGAPPAVDGLVAVANDRDLVMEAGEEKHQLVLGPVGVLVFVHQDVAKAALVVVEHVGAGLQQVDCHQEEVVEVHGVGRQQTLLVIAVHLGDPALHDGAGPAGVGLEVDQLVFGRRDQGVDGPGRKLLGVQVEVPNDIPGEAHGVGLVVDGEVALVAQAAGVTAENAYAGGVERRHPHAPGHRAYQDLDPFPHLLGRLVGEGDGQDLEGGHALLGDQPRDAVRKDPGLARTGAGHDEQRAARMGDRLSLDRVEAVEQGGPSGRAALRRVRGDVQRHGLIHGTRCM